MLQPHLEAARIAQAGNRRRVDRNDDAIVLGHEVLAAILDDRERGGVLIGALTEGFETDEKGAGTWEYLRINDAIAGIARRRTDTRLGLEPVGPGFREISSALQAGCLGHHDSAKEVSLVFLWNKGTRDDAEQHE